jgi:hypothetical protein
VIRNQDTRQPPALILSAAGRLLHAEVLFVRLQPTRPAKVGDKLVTKQFGAGIRGFASVEDLSTAVCVLPGTELAFAGEVSYLDWGIRSFLKAMQITTQYTAAIFRQINKQKTTHHDALEFPDGQVVLLTRLSEGQQATVLQLPAEPHFVEDAERQKRSNFSLRDR